MFNRIVVPLDGSSVAEYALPRAQELASLMGASLHLIRVIDLAQADRYGVYALTLDGRSVAQLLQEAHSSALEYLTNLAERLGQTGIAISTEQRQDGAARGIIGASRPGDLIVMATHGATGVKPWFLGSVAEELVRHAPVPLLLMHPEAERCVPQPVRSQLAHA
jgi:nucleotide-binding universal stress UspA family protein